VKEISELASLHRVGWRSRRSAIPAIIARISETAAEQMDADRRFLTKVTSAMDETDLTAAHIRKRATALVESTGSFKGVANQFLDRVRRAIAK